MHLVFSRGNQYLRKMQRMQGVLPTPYRVTTRSIVHNAVRSSGRTPYSFCVYARQACCALSFLTVYGVTESNRDVTGISERDISYECGCSA